MCPAFAQFVDTGQVILVLDTRAHPDMGCPGEAVAQRCQTSWPFGQQLIPVPIRAVHHVKNSSYELEWNILVEEVAHAVDEDGLRFFPGHGQFKGVLVQGQFEGVAVNG